MTKSRKHDLRKGMWERGPVKAGNRAPDEREVPVETPTGEDIASPDLKVPDGQTTHQ
ncbi:MAG TPA: hypothetical protein VMH86_10265 [Rhizomicrobium sp.]|nr:hypothetical protein [Rhizomicrobium sp.]